MSKAYSTLTPKKFQDARKRLGLTQGALAREIGVARNTIARWECGINPIPYMAEILLARLQLSSRDRA